jgi:hypothetical protein
MWFVYFVLVMTTVVSLSLFGWATYLEESGKRTVSPIAKSVPLPQPRPRQQVAEVTEKEVVTVPKTAGVARRAKRKRHRGPWVD